MSITIKHLDGPLKGTTQEFDDMVGTILVGRSREAQVTYPAERIEIHGKHLKLVRGNDGQYAIELAGSGSVEIDDKPAETFMAAPSGSVITVGVGGPSFEIIIPGVTIKHLEGPLAGQHQYFSDTVETIVFGRPPQKTDVSYPANYTKVGRLHFSLKRNELGEYCVELTPNHYVEIDGVEADNGALVTSGSTFRLGNADGPTFSVAIEKPKGAGAVTEPNKPPKPVRKELERWKTVVAYALAAVFLSFGGFAIYWDWKYEQRLAELVTGLAAADAKLSELAKNDIPEPAREALQAAVYLVAKKEGGSEIGQATAWAFAPDKLATNAHVTEEIKGHEGEFVLVGPHNERIGIKSVKSHPGYLAFKAYKTTQGQVTYGNFKPLDVINEYDVGIIYPSELLPADPKTGKFGTLELASKDELEALKPGAAVASVGFPIEGMAASMVVTKAPSALRFGNISSLTDIFMCRAAPNHRLLIQHSVPVTGGVSGSPLIDKSGKVIGIVNGGNIATLLKEGETARIPSAAQINFAQRIDLLEELDKGVADQELVAEHDYWKTAAGQFANYFDTAVNAFKTLAAERYGVGEAQKQTIGEGTLQPRRGGIVKMTYNFVLEPGHVYGLIADAKSGVRIALNVNKQGTSEFLKDAKDPRPMSVSELAPTAWVTVSEETPVEINVLGRIDQPADYVVYVYDWKEMPSATTSSAAPSQ